MASVNTGAIVVATFAALASPCCLGLPRSVLVGVLYVLLGSGVGGVYGLVSIEEGGARTAAGSCLAKHTKESWIQQTSIF